MKLDNRPKTLIIKGLEGNDTGVHEWYSVCYVNLQLVHMGLTSILQAQGPVELSTTSDGLLAAFSTRSAAEQALAKGPPPGSVSIGWHVSSTAGAPSGTKSTVPNTPLSASTSAFGDEDTATGVDATTGLNETNQQAVDAPEIGDRVAEVAQGEESQDNPSAIRHSHDVYDDAWGAGGGFDD